MFTRVKTDNLSFLGERLIRGRHKIHPYPAMLHPLLVDYLLSQYSSNEKIVFDPFCGSGVTLLQSSLYGCNSIGFDINPLALLIAKTKTRTFNIFQLNKEYTELRHAIEESEITDVPDINNIQYWYSSDVIEDLGRIRHIIKNAQFEYRDFFITCFAYVCRNQSLTRNGEFKRYRMSEDRLELFQNQVFKRFYTHIESNIKEFSLDTFKAIPKIYLQNSEDSFRKNIKYDLVITSPPYGDSRTTVAYGQYSSFGSDWVQDLTEFHNVNYRVDNESLGKKGIVNQEIFNNDILVTTYKKIKKQDYKRADDVINFFNGYFNSLKNIERNLNSRGTICLVVGNRTVKGITIPMDQITSKFLLNLGLNFEGIFIRDITNKVMPLRNSPTNLTGKKSKTMANEYIVVFQKQ